LPLCTLTTYDAVTFTEICHHIPALIDVSQQLTDASHEHLREFLQSSWPELAKCLSEQEIFQTQLAQTSELCFMTKTFFSASLTAMVGRPGFESRQEKNLSLFHSVQTGYRAHPAFYPLGSEDNFPGSKAAGE
jgi:hypothetical protein